MPLPAESSSIEAVGSAEVGRLVVGADEDGTVVEG